MHPIVLAHARALLNSHEAGATEYIHADLRNTDTILDQAARLLDFTRPVAVTLLAILHVIPDSDDPHAIVAKLMDAVPAGSHLAVSHVASELLDKEAQGRTRDLAGRMIQQQPMNGAQIPARARQASRPGGVRWGARADAAAGYLDASRMKSRPRPSRTWSAQCCCRPSASSRNCPSCRPPR